MSWQVDEFKLIRRQNNPNKQCWSYGLSHHKYASVYVVEDCDTGKRDYFWVNDEIAEVGKKYRQEIDRAIKRWSETKIPEY